MTNGEKFNALFGLYATELWAKPEKEFLKWINADASDINVDTTDCVNRLDAIDAAIDAVDEWDGWCDIGRQKRIYNAIMVLPPARPEILTKKEQQILMFAIDLGIEACREFDKNVIREAYETPLVDVCKKIKEKVISSLCTN